MSKKTYKQFAWWLLIIFFPFILFFISAKISNKSLKLDNQLNSTAESVSLSNDKSKQRYYTLRDDYILFNQYQANTGLCWDFSITKSLETALMLANKEMYDFSEASISALHAGHIADGGNFTIYNKLLNKHGIAFESDFRFGDLYHFPNAGAYYHKLLELYKPKYITNLADKLETVEFDKTKIGENLNAIKHHIVNHSSLVTNVEHWTTTKRKINSRDIHEIVHYGGAPNLHSVAIIGWDDDYVSISGKKGAFIVLNSDWPYFNNDGTNYLPYDSLEIVSSLYGFKYKAPKYISSRSNTSIKNKYSGFYDSKRDHKYNYAASPLNQNVFNWNDEIKIEYQFNEFYGKINSFNARIYQDGFEITNKFKIEKNHNTLIVISNDRTLNPGSYTVKLDYSFIDKNKTKNEQEVRQIYVLDGSEGLMSHSYWQYNENAPYNHFIFHSANGYNLNKKTPVILSSEKNDNYSLMLNYLNQDNKVEYKVNNESISANRSWVFDLRLNKLNTKHSNNDEYFADIDTYVNGQKTKTTKYKIYRLNTNRNYIIAKFYYDLNGSYIDNIVSEVPFDFNKSDQKFFINDANKSGSKFKRYEYVTKDGQYKELPKDISSGKYYVSSEIIKSLKQSTNDLNVVYSRGLDQYYNTPVIIKPIFENENAKIDVDVLRGKTEFSATTKVNTTDFQLRISDNANSNIVIPNRIVYSNDENIIKSTDKFIELEFDYKNQIYRKKIDIKVNKKVIYDDLKLVKSTFKYNGQGQQPQFNHELDHSLVNVSGNYNTQIGTYTVKLQINNSEYTFPGNKDELEFNWSIIDPSSYNEEYNNNINANTNDDVKQEDSVKNNSSLDPNEANNHIHDQFRINNIASSSGVIDINNRSVHNIERKDNKNELNNKTNETIKILNQAKTGLSLQAIIIISVSSAIVLVITISLVAVKISKSKKHK
ncbi:C1 family peptidase [Mycoplasmopsis bovis]|uniref:C1 family peptidase n=1 Tax=Mycoplasmopsis bovis TaxID=28903 RepID=UPI001EE7056C|nr:C1 family peptidase [Mycoplasmopsis bovis]